MEEIYNSTITRLNNLYSQKYRGLITFSEFASEQQMALLDFSIGIKEKVHEKIEEDIQESYLLKIESELQ